MQCWSDQGTMLPEVDTSDVDVAQFNVLQRPRQCVSENAQREILAKLAAHQKVTGEQLPG